MYKKIYFCNFGKKQKERILHSEMSTKAQQLHIHTVELDTTSLYIEVGKKDEKASVYSKGKKISLTEDSYFFIRSSKKGHPMTYLLANLLHMRNIPFSDIVHIHHDILSDKTAQVVFLAEAELAVPHSIIVSASHVSDILSDVKSTIEYPCVVKIRGSQGRGVKKVYSEKELMQHISLVRDENELVTIQEVIENTYDVRVLVFEEKIIASMRRSGNGFLNNISQGGTASSDVLSKNEALQCKQAVKQVGLSFAGVDFIRTNRGIVFLEINKAPQLGGIREVYPELNIGESILKNIIKNNNIAAIKTNYITKSIIKAADKLGVSHTMLGKSTYILHYKHKDVVFIEAMPETTPASSLILCKHKDVGARALRKWKFPVLDSELYSSKTKAYDFLLKYKKIVVKPADGAHGNGVSLNVTSQKQLNDALLYAQRFSNSKKIILEQQFSGRDYRILVVGKNIFALERVPAHVIGDGKHSIVELIDIVNKYRAQAQLNMHRPHIILNKQMESFLKSKNITTDTVLPKNEKIYLTQIANIAQGGTVIDITDTLPKHIADMAHAVAQKLNMDILALDVMSKNIHSSKDQYVILEMNSYPGLRGHMYPDEGTARDVPEAIVKLFL